MMTNDERLTSLEKRTASLEARLAANLPSETVGEGVATNERRIVAQVDHLATLLEISDRPQFFIAAMPFEVIELEDIFESSSQSTKIFENPVRVREEGFGMYPADRRSAITKGQLREAKLNTQARTISRDGQFVALFRGDDDFLGWAMKSTGWPMTPEQQATPYRVNSLVLIEATYGCILLTKELFKAAKPTPLSIQYTIGLRHMRWNGKGPLLLNGKADRNLHHYPQVQADIDGCIYSVLANYEQTPERIGFRLISEIFRLFGLPDDRVPYAEVIDGNRQIVPSQF